MSFATGTFDWHMVEASVESGEQSVRHCFPREPSPPVLAQRFLMYFPIWQPPILYGPPSSAQKLQPDASFDLQHGWIDS